MKNFFTILYFLLGTYNAEAGVWTKINASTIQFDGYIERGEFQKFSEVFDYSVKEIIVNSGGGNTADGIKIGLRMAERPIKVTVIGKCLSSCANYIFVAGRERELREGIVGFHGNVKACFSGPKLQPALDDIRAQLRQEDPPLSEDEIKSVLDRFIAENEKQISDEAKLLTEIGISQELFDRSCEADKGMGDGKEYSFLLPKPATFLRYGFLNIIGDQSETIIKNYPGPLLLD